MNGLRDRLIEAREEYGNPRAKYITLTERHGNVYLRFAGAELARICGGQLHAGKFRFSLPLLESTTWCIIMKHSPKWFSAENHQATRRDTLEKTLGWFSRESSRLCSLYPYFTCIHPPRLHSFYKTSMICGGLSERQIAEYEPDYRLHLLIINAVYDILPQPIAEEISCNIHPWHLSIQNYSPLHPRRRPDYSGVLACHDELVRGLPERYPHAYWLPLRLSMNMTASITKQLDYETAEAYLAGLE